MSPDILQMSPRYPQNIPKISQKIQCVHCTVQSSLAQNGGADLRPHCIKKIQTTFNMWMGRPQLFPEIFEIVLRPIWCDAGSEQPSPPLHRATAAQLLSWSKTLPLLLLFTSISWSNSFCISIWKSHISAGEWELDQWHCICFLQTPTGKTMGTEKLRRIFLLKIEIQILNENTIFLVFPKRARVMIFSFPNYVHFTEQTFSEESPSSSLIHLEICIRTILTVVTR